MKFGQFGMCPILDVPNLECAENEMRSFGTCKYWSEQKM